MSFFYDYRANDVFRIAKKDRPGRLCVDSLSLYLAVNSLFEIDSQAFIGRSSRAGNLVDFAIDSSFGINSQSPVGRD